MKTIILISSIFYILGLKISNKIDLIKKVNPVEKITIHKAKPEKPENTIEFKAAQKENQEAQPAETEKETTDME